MKTKRKIGFFSWYFQLPLAVVCGAIYWHARLYEERREPVAMGIAIGAFAAGVYDLVLARRLKRQTRERDRDSSEQ